MAHEAIDSGTWSGAASSVPVTAKDEMLAALDISNEDHPRLLDVSPCKMESKLSVSQDEESAVSGPESRTGIDHSLQGTEQNNNSNGNDSSSSRVTERFSTSGYDVSPIDDRSSHAALVYMAQHSAGEEFDPLSTAHDEDRG